MGASRGALLNLEHIVECRVVVTCLKLNKLRILACTVALQDD